MRSDKFRPKYYLSLLVICIFCQADYLTAQINTLNPEGNGVLAYCYQPLSGDSLKKIFRIKENSTDNIQIGNLPVSVNAPKWSPDGTRLVIYGYPNATTWSIYLIKSNGSGFIRLTNTNDVWDNSLAWSPDGTKIVFTRTYPNING